MCREIWVLPACVHLGGSCRSGARMLVFPLAWSLFSGYDTGVFSIRFSKESVTFQGYQPLLPDFRVFSPYSWEKITFIILWVGKLRPHHTMVGLIALRPPFSSCS